MGSAGLLVTFALFAIGQGFSEWNVISDSPARPTTLPGYVPEPIESVPWGPLPTVAEALKKRVVLCLIKA